MLAEILGAVLENPNNVSCDWASAHSFKTSDHMPATIVGLHYVFTIHTLQLEKSLRKPSYSEMGQNDKLVFPIGLLPRIVTCLDCKWM